MKAYPYRWRRLVAQAIAAGARCAECGTDRDLEGDHDLAVSRGGLSTRANLVIRCRYHNRSKGNRPSPRTQLTLDAAMTAHPGARGSDGPRDRSRCPDFAQSTPTNGLDSNDLSRHTPDGGRAGPHSSRSPAVTDGPRYP